MLDNFCWLPELVVCLDPTVTLNASWLLLTPSLRFGQLGSFNDCWSAECTDGKAVFCTVWFNVSSKLSGRSRVRETNCSTDAPFVLCNGWLDATPELKWVLRFFFNLIFSYNLWSNYLWAITSWPFRQLH